MSVSNTSILIKRSTTNSTPSSLKAGEIAYSYQSNTFFIGTPDSTSALALGGYNTYQAVNNATAANTASTLVQRDVNNAFYGRLYGDANTATTLLNGRNFSISGGDITAGTQAFDGSASVVLNASLNTIAGLTAGTYGSSTLIPIVTVAANGRIVAIQNSSSSLSATSNFTVSGNTGSSTFYTGNTFHVVGGTGTGITTTETTIGNDAYININIDTTIARSNTTAVGPQTISTDLTVAGNLVITGTATYVNTATVQTNDSLIKLAANNIVNDVVDIGFYGSSNTGSSVQYHGLIREGSGGTNAGNFYLFKNLSTDPTTNTVSYAGLAKATLYADLTGSTGLPVSTGISGLGTGIATALSVNTGSTGSVVLYNGALGTPTSGTLTNATGLPVSTGISGLGTGVATALAAGVTGTGNIVLAQSPTFTGTATFTNINAASINVGTTTYVATNVLGSFQGSTNGYEQFIIQNSNNGSQASVDFIVSNDKSADNGYYGDYGMNSSGFSGSGSFSLPNAVYLASANTDLSIGTYNANAIHFVVNSGSTDAMTISSSGAVTLGTALGVASGGTGATSFTTGAILVGSGTGALTTLANSSFTATGSGAANNTVSSLTVDSYGRATAVTYSAISGLTVGQGGTGLSTITTNGITYGNGTGVVGVTAAAGSSDQTWSNQILTVTNAGVPVWSSALDGGSF
jgi:hypothetical protein